MASEDAVVKIIMEEGRSLADPIRPLPGTEKPPKEEKKKPEPEERVAGFLETFSDRIGESMGNILRGVLGREIADPLIDFLKAFVPREKEQESRESVQNQGTPASTEPGTTSPSPASDSRIGDSITATERDGLPVGRALTPAGSTPLTATKVTTDNLVGVSETPSSSTGSSAASSTASSGATSVAGALTTTTQTAKTASDAARVATTATTAATTVAGSLAGPAGLLVGAVVGKGIETSVEQLVTLVFSIKSQLDQMLDLTRAYSPELAQSGAEAEIREMKMLMRRAEKAGGTLADYERFKTDINIAIGDLVTNMIASAGRVQQSIHEFRDSIPFLKQLRDDVHEWLGLNIDRNEADINMDEAADFFMQNLEEEPRAMPPQGLF